MKQQASSAQWGELSYEQQQKFIAGINSPIFPIIRGLFPEVATPSIGHLIEYLGDDWWDKVDSGHMNHLNEWEEDLPKNDELCDAVFQDVKQKLNYDKSKNQQ